MTPQLILASQSSIRSDLLRRANIRFMAEAAGVDEEAIKSSMLAESEHPRNIADALAEAKARKVANRHPSAMVLGCDQVLALGRKIFSKPDSKTDAVDQIRELRGKTHHLYSAAVIYEGGEPIWRHVGQVQLTMRAASDEYISDYVKRNWSGIRYSVGGYKLEEEGVRLFSRIDGDYFSVLGLPLLELLSYLTQRGTLPG